MLWCAACRRVLFASAAACGTCGGPLEPLTERSLLGWTLSGRFRVDRLLGRGGMGAVYEGEQLRLRRRVAVKVLLPHASVDDTLRQRFLREAELVGRLKHPGIVEVVDFDVAEEGLPFLVMEYLEGRTLRRVLDGFPKGVPLALFGAWMGQIGGALEVAHRAGVVHRDLKPENVMLVPYGDGSERIKLLDFGLARLSDESGSFVLTTSSTLLGTPYYMAPEQFRGEAVDVQTDVYALGVMAFELLCGEPPFPSKSIGHLAHQHLHVAPPDLGARGLPDALAQAVARALAKEPRERWPDVRSFVRALETATGTGGAETPTVVFASDAAPRAEREQRTPIETSPTVRLSTQRSARPRPRRGRRALLAAAGLGAVVALVLGVRAGRRPPDPLERARSAGFRPVELPASGLGDLVAVAAPPQGIGLFLFRSGSVAAWSPIEGFAPGLALSVNVAARVPSADGTIWLAGTDGRSLHRFDAEARRIVESVKTPPFLAAAALSGDTFGLLAAEPPRWLVVARDGAESAPAVPLAAPFGELALAPGGARVVLLGASTLSVRSLPKLETLEEVTAPEPLLHGAAAAFSPDGRFLAFGFRTLTVRDLEAKRTVASLPAGGWIRGIGWLPGGALSIVDDRGTLHVADDPAKGWSLEVPSSPGTYGAGFDERSLRWAVAGRDGVRLWEVRRPAPVLDADLRRLETWSLAPDPKGSLVAVSGKDREIALFDLARGAVAGTLAGHGDGVPMVRFAPDGKLVSASDDGTLRVWDAHARKLVKTVEGHRSLVNAFAFTPDGKRLVSVASDKAVKLWEWPAMTLARVLAETKNAGAAAAFLPGDGATLLVTDWSGNGLLLTGPELSRSGSLAVPGAVFYALCATPKGWWAASLGEKEPGTYFLPRAPFGTAERLATEPVSACAALGGGETAFLGRGGISVRSDDTHALLREIRFSPVGGAALALAGSPPRLLAGLADGRLLGFALGR